ncbi:MAG: ATP-binding cassette domain-containing protein [Deltaproteobacteria bacterium]|nr:ATP-binding cassette domain-containing protein [Deltaproteobacteria bacterium]MBW2180952.1 ATP-binding cassette domain-containing protein [Deltaproteobacteria bacterium]
MRFECKNITFQYPGSDDHVFRDLSFKITEPGFHAIFGPSGVGKTSFAKIVTGDIQGFTGDIQTESMKTFLYSYNLERLPGWSSIENHIEKIMPSKRKDRKDELVDSFGVREQMDSRFSQLSLGQQNRVNLIRYLLQDFDLLIMDESLANVDEFRREKIILKIKDMFPEACFLYISHNVIEVSRFCKHILVFRDNRKNPQIQAVRGQNYSTGQIIEKKDLELTMLEIMNAS